jgi:hypothetical protein
MSQTETIASFETWRNSYELPRIPLLGTWVNRGASNERAHSTTIHSHDLRDTTTYAPGFSFHSARSAL